MVTALSIVLLGFLLGMRHATDADHVVAISTIVTRERTVRSASLIGALWGIGHTLTLVAAGGLILLCGVVIPRRTGLALEFLVALMLIALGALNFRSLRLSIRQRFAGSGEEIPCVAKHDHETRVGRWFGTLKSGQIARPMIVGVVHGLAGSAAVALLVLPIIKEPMLALAYLLIFGIGTIAGMMLITGAIALPIACTARRSNIFSRHLGLATGLVSMGFGLFLAYQIGFQQGLFTK